VTSILKIDNIKNTSDKNIINEVASTVTIGASGDTITVASGAALATDSLTISGNSIQARLFPTVSSISPTSISASTPTNITITGSNYIATPIVEAHESATGAVTLANSVTFNSSSSLTCNFTLANTGTYYLRIENNTGFAGRSTTALLTVS
jgi:hypothetical protein